MQNPLRPAIISGLSDLVPEPEAGALKTAKPSFSSLLTSSLYSLNPLRLGKIAPIKRGLLKLKNLEVYFNSSDHLNSKNGLSFLDSASLSSRSFLSMDATSSLVSMTLSGFTDRLVAPSLTRNSTISG